LQTGEFVSSPSVGAHGRAGLPNGDQTTIAVSNMWLPKARFPEVADFVAKVGFEVVLIASADF
jgi:hypothetical protein